MSGAIHPLPNTPSWRGTQFKAQEQLYLYLTVAMFRLSIRTVMYVVKWIVHYATQNCVMGSLDGVLYVGCIQ
jgi:hypothetical protein